MPEDPRAFVLTLRATGASFKDAFEVCRNAFKDQDPAALEPLMEWGRSEGYSVIKDEFGGSERVLVQVRSDGGGIRLMPEGFDGQVLLELLEGQLRLVVWADKDVDEPTHIISFEGARH